MNGEVVSGPGRLTDVRVVRALSHPVRLALLEALALHGDLTATGAAELIGESPTTCSFHFRQLARYGFVEEVGGGPGRSRPWRAVRVGWSITEEDGDDPAAVVAGERLSELTLRRQLERHATWRRERRALPARWSRTGGSTQTVWWVTPEEAAELDEQITALATRYQERLLDPAARPSGSAPVEFVGLIHLWDPSQVRVDPVDPTSDSDRGGVAP